MKFEPGQLCHACGHRTVGAGSKCEQCGNDLRGNLPLKSDLRASELVSALEDLLNCCELNLDDMEEDTHAAIERARTALAKALGEA